MNKSQEEIERENEIHIKEYKQRFLEKSNFPPFRGVRDSKTDYKQAFQHTTYLLFIRAKFLFLATLDELEKNNAFAAFALLKSYWETVAALGYFVITIKNLLEAKDFDQIVKLSRKIAMGGKKFPTEEITKNNGGLPEDFQQPNLLTMMEKIDKDFAKISNKEGLEEEKSSFSHEYNVFIAESGHPTFIGLFPGGRMLADGSLLPDINRSGDEEDKKTIVNYLCLSSIFFFYYWEISTKLK